FLWCSEEMDAVSNGRSWCVQIFRPRKFKKQRGSLNKPRGLRNPALLVCPYYTVRSRSFCHLSSSYCIENYHKINSNDPNITGAVFYSVLVNRKLCQRRPSNLLRAG